MIFIGCRGSYYHRDININNVYLPWTMYDKDGTIPKASYGEAMLKLSSHTQIVHDGEKLSCSSQVRMNTFIVLMIK